jgi:penicillin-binding protein 1C
VRCGARAGARFFTQPARQWKAAVHLVTQPARQWKTAALVAIPLLRRRWKAAALLAPLIAGGLWFWNCLPDPLFDAPCSTVLVDRDGGLLGASIAADQQWRFPPRADTVPPEFAAALTLYEDKRFHRHPGVDPLALARALRQNLEAGEVVSGASTITMQVIRLSRPGAARTVPEKLLEMVMALRLELDRDKKQVLALFASHAPFGGNVVGIDAAAWRYFGREPERLTWAEHAMLAVLPNNPALVHPGRNRPLLLEKRNQLLDSLHERGTIDAATCRLATQEPLPPEPLPLPMRAPHLLARAAAGGKIMTGTGTSAPVVGGGEAAPGTLVRTTLDPALQDLAVQVLERHQQSLRRAGIHNAAALILEVKTGRTAAYVGNTGEFTGGKHASQVDMITARRSTGSILKPLLYAAMIQKGELLPSQLVADIPTKYGSFMPENYSRSYLGAVPAYRVLSRSLNVPAVRMLHRFGVDRFQAFLKNLGMTTLHREADEYGLSLILGGAEGTLWELTSIYRGLALRALGDAPLGDAAGAGPLSPAACWLTLQAMVEAERPDEENAWREFSSSQLIAWKTGTSYGFRDAWAIGVTPEYAVGVWAGNADGEGRPGLIGSRAAAPILFDLFDLVGRSPWFEQPAGLKEVTVCARSGHPAGLHCSETAGILSPAAGTRVRPCFYCRRVHLDQEKQYQVNSSCMRVELIHSEDRFVLPPAMEYYYKKANADYRPLPAFHPACLLPGGTGPGNPAGALSILYPHPGSRIYIPLEVDGRRGKTVFQAAHRDASARIHWHLDNTYLGTTVDIHRMSLSPEAGAHRLVLVDDSGASRRRDFVILSREDAARQ